MLVEHLRTIERKKFKLKLFSKFSFILLLPFTRYWKICYILFKLFYLLLFDRLLSYQHWLLLLLTQMIHFLRNKSQFSCFFFPLSLPLHVFFNLKLLLHLFTNFCSMRLLKQFLFFLCFSFRSYNWFLFL